MNKPPEIPATKEHNNAIEWKFSFHISIGRPAFAWAVAAAAVTATILYFWLV